MLVSGVETSVMEVGSGMFTVDEGVGSEMWRRGEGVLSGTTSGFDWLFG